MPARRADRTIEDAQVGHLVAIAEGATTAPSLSARRQIRPRRPRTAREMRAEVLCRRPRDPGGGHKGQPTATGWLTAPVASGSEEFSIQDVGEPFRVTSPGPPSELSGEQVMKFGTGEGAVPFGGIVVGEPRAQRAAEVGPEELALGLQTGTQQGGSEFGGERGLVSCASDHRAEAGLVRARIAQAELDPGSEALAWSRQLPDRLQTTLVRARSWFHRWPSG